MILNRHQANRWVLSAEVSFAQTRAWSQRLTTSTMPGVVNKQGVDAVLVKMELDEAHLASHVRFYSLSLCPATLSSLVYAIDPEGRPHKHNCILQGAGKGKRVMGGVPAPEADQAELKLEQLVDQRDMAVSMEGEAAEPDTHRRSEILAISDVRLPLPSFYQNVTVHIPPQNQKAGYQGMRIDDSSMAVQVQLPLQIGTRVDCRWRDGEYYTARVVERRLVDGSDVHEYYVHYLKCNYRFLNLLALQM